LISCGAYLVLESRQRSRGWLSLAAAGPFGFSVIAALEDRAPAPRDLYQGFITNLKTYWRVPLELTVFVLIWVVSYNLAIDLDRHFDRCVARQRFVVRQPRRVRERGRMAERLPQLLRHVRPERRQHQHERLHRSALVERPARTAGVVAADVSTLADRVQCCRAALAQMTPS